MQDLKEEMILLIDGKKISGNAEHIFKKRVLHHGTLLFSSVMNDLSQALKVNPLKYNDKGVKSVRSRVANISDYLSEKITVMEFRDKILSYILDSDDKAKIYKYNKNDIEQINQLVKDKYSTWEWNFGYSPKYNFEKSVETKSGNLEIQMNVEKGLIKDINILDDFLTEYDTYNIQKLLVGIEHEENSIRKTLQKTPFTEYFHNTTINELILAMF